jgi:hypothetical protein
MRDIHKSHKINTPHQFNREINGVHLTRQGSRQVGRSEN